MRIGIVGAGGVGAYLAVLLDGKAEVALVDVGEHLRALQTEGVLVRSRDRGELRGRFQATDDPSEIGTVDLVLYAAKTYDNDAAIPAMRPLIGPQTSILTVQNGIGNVEQLAEAYGADAVLGGAMQGGGTRVAPGVVEHTAAIDGESIELGAISPSGRTDVVAAVLGQSGMAIRVVDDIQLSLWAKVLQMASLSAVGCLTRTITAEWRDHPETRRLYETLVREAAAVGRAEGIALDDATVEGVLAQPDRLNPKHRTSMSADLERGERLEVGAVQGEIVRRAAHHGIPVPAFQTAYAVLQHADDRAAQRSLAS
jgi:2-dehydropantoate 2-reductase